SSQNEPNQETGMTQLAPQFIQQGIPNVLAGQFALPDQPTIEFWRAFYRSLLFDRLSFEEAIQNTRHHLATTHREPFWSNIALLSKQVLFEKIESSSKDFAAKSIDKQALDNNSLEQFEDGLPRLFEANLFILGEPGAGATSLVHKLIEPNVSTPTRKESTEGIDINVWTFPLADLGAIDSQIFSTTDFRVNIWDFGGQEIYHATHQFFLRRHSLYVLAADAREQKTDFYYWLNLIQHLGDRSPVIIFNNEIQNRPWAINEQRLRANFPDIIQGVFAFNLANDNESLANLRMEIQDQIIKLPHIGDILPVTWINVRHALEADTRPAISLQEFLHLCLENGLSR
ncbi:MAG: CHAT domain-containing protein, partial [Anaerolineales bacterium]|nr:CHAT domain-containing protein [Anaerolineales bacterium]